MKNYNKTKPIRIEEFEAEKAWWGSEADGYAAPGGKRTGLESQHRPAQGRQLEPGPEKPPVGEQISHDPDELLADYARLQAEAQALRDELKDILAQSLAVDGKNSH